MRLTDKTDYALRVLMLLANAEHRCTVVDMAKWLSVSANHLNKVVQALQASGWVSTTRGRGGGVELAIAPESLTVGMVVRTIEPDFNLVECQRESGVCPFESGCALWSALDQARAAFLASLDPITLQEITQNSKPINLISLPSTPPPLSPS